MKAGKEGKPCASLSLYNEVEKLFRKPKRFLSTFFFFLYKNNIHSSPYRLYITESIAQKEIKYTIIINITLNFKQ